MTRWIVVVSLFKRFFSNTVDKLTKWYGISAKKREEITYHEMYGSCAMKWKNKKPSILSLFKKHTNTNCFFYLNKNNSHKSKCWCETILQVWDICFNKCSWISLQRTHLKQTIIFDPFNLFSFISHTRYNRISPLTDKNYWSPEIR